jgi:transcriptional regulator with XRE-family HTH domain
MQTTTTERRTALQEMWPQIGGYCESLGLTRERLMSGIDGIPVDGRQLEGARGAAWLTVAELAGEAGITRDMMYKIINNRRAPTPVVLWRLARALGISPGRLLPPSDGHGGYA